MVAKKSNKKSNGVVVAVIAGLLIVAVLMTAVVLLGGSKDNSDSAGSSYSDPTTGLQVSYNPEIELKANDPPVQGVIFNMTKSDPRLQVTAWYEDGEAVTKAKAAEKPLNQSMLDNFIAQLEENYPGATVVDSKTSTINGYPSAELTFDYKTKSGVEMRQRVLILVKDDDTVIRIAMLSEQEDFEKVNQEYFDQIADGAKF